MLKAPFPYFGGKSSVAHIVWQALGDVPHYIEPFFGSGAVLLQRPHDFNNRTETINDKDCLVANFWRAIKHDPEQTAYYADNPVNHADIEARRRFIVKHANRLCELMLSSPAAFDAEIAGYWVYVMGCWIGTPDFKRQGNNKIPHISTKGLGIHSDSSHLTDENKGIISAIPHLGHKGRGVNSTISHLSDEGQSVFNSTDYDITDIVPRNIKIYQWFRQLADRFKKVRVVCGEWHRVCGGDWQDKAWGTVGIFFDPPYSKDADRTEKLYNVDCLKVAKEVAQWCFERGSRNNYRIVLAGYYQEHEWLLQHGWRAYRYHVSGGYSNRDNQNRFKETLFFSPHCFMTDEERQHKLFEFI